MPGAAGNLRQIRKLIDNDGFRQEDAQHFFNPRLVPDPEASSDPIWWHEIKFQSPCRLAVTKFRIEVLERPMLFSPN